MVQKNLSKASGKSGRKKIGGGAPSRRLGANGRPAPSALRGLLATRRAVARLVDREVRARPMTDEARRRLLEDFTLQYYFGGWDIAYRRTDQGPEVLAVGSEIGDLFGRLPPDERRHIILGHPGPW